MATRGKTPTRKVANGAASGGLIGAPLASVLAWLWGVLYPETPMPPEVAAALGGLIGTIASFVAAWFAREDALVDPGLMIERTAAEVLRRLHEDGGP